MKKIRGKRGKPDTIEYLVNIDTVQYDISKEQLADFREIFALYDKDGDGILTFTEVTSAMKTAGQRIPGSKYFQAPALILLTIHIRGIFMKDLDFVVRQRTIRWNFYSKQEAQDMQTK